MTAPRLEIAIGELVFRGLSTADARLATAALEARLTELAAGVHSPVAARAEAFRLLPAVEAPAGSPRALGNAVAGAVWHELDRGGRR
jgi:hypothetical protein